MPGLSARSIQVTDGRKIRFLWVDVAIVDHDLATIGPDAFAVYAVLSRFAGNSTQRAWPSLMTIADVVGLSRNTVKKSIKTLVEAELVSVKKQGRPGRQHNVYTLLAAKTQGRTRSRRDPAVPSDDRAGLQSGPELNEVELDQRNKTEETEQGITDVTHQLPFPPLNQEDFEFCCNFLNECGLNPKDKRNAGALRSVWAATEDSPDRREAFKEAIETALGYGIEHPSGIFGFAKRYLTGGLY